jgi:hypothetical protein
MPHDKMGFTYTYQNLGSKSHCSFLEMICTITNSFDQEILSSDDERKVKFDHHEQVNEVLFGWRSK